MSLHEIVELALHKIIFDAKKQSSSMEIISMGMTRTNDNFHLEKQLLI